MTGLLRRARALTGADSGMSVVELLVTMVLLTLILLMASNMYISVTQTTTQTQSVNEGTRVASNAMNEINRVVRFAVDNPRSNDTPLPAFSSAKASELTVFSLVDTDALASVADRPLMPVMVSFELGTDGNIAERRWKPAPAGSFWAFGAASPPTAQLSRVLGGKFLASGTTESLFRYFDSNGVELIPAANLSLNAADRAKIKSVLVTMNTVPLDSPDDTPVVIENMIGMLNLVELSGGAS